MTRSQLLSMGPQALIMDVLAVFTDGPNHDWAVRDMPNIKKGLEGEGRSFTTMADMASYSPGEISGPQARYAGNKSKAWMGWAMRQFGLEHQLIGY